MKSSRGISLYIHIPFCLRKCRYCDFLSTGDCSEQMQSRYLACLQQEMELWHRKIKDRPVRTVYVGGGTPTSLSLQHLQQLMQALSIFNLSGVEVTVEVNPGTVDAARLAVLRSGGVNRLSIGVQSFSDRLLAAIGRIHTAKQALDTFELARRAGFSNINLDLMFALPGQSRSDWQHTLGRAIELDPEHIAAYSLILEPGTPLAADVQAGRSGLPGEEEETAMYLDAIEQLQKAGYRHYEVSNFARPGCECRHNLVYWRNEEYAGMGLGAHSFWSGCRRANEPELSAYCQRVRRGYLPQATVIHPDRELEMAETMMMGLRLLSGVSFQRFRSRFGVDLRQIYARKLQRLESRKLLIVDERGVRLSRKGLLLANTVWAEFIG